jgi:hypothetical protein
MNSEAVAVAGTLAGAIVGALLSYINQMVGYRRESAERARVTQRESYIDFLTRLDSMYGQMRETSGAHRRGEISKTELVETMRGISPRAAQSSLEGLRLVASDSVAECAAKLWSHMRRDPVPQGVETSSTAWRQWQTSYWELRRALLDAARQDLGKAPLDWDRAGVSPISS